MKAKIEFLNFKASHSTYKSVEQIVSEPVLHMDSLKFISITFTKVEEQGFLACLRVLFREQEFKSWKIGLSVSSCTLKLVNDLIAEISDLKSRGVFLKKTKKVNLDSFGFPKKS